MRPSELIYSKDFSIWRNFWRQYTAFNKIQLFDTYEVFEKHIKDTEKHKQFYIPGDYHFNDKGNKLIGKFIYDNY